MKASGKTNFLIDGFPRNKDNVEGWNEAMEGKANVQCVLFFDCDEQVRICEIIAFFRIEFSRRRHALLVASNAEKEVDGRMIMKRV